VTQAKKPPEKPEAGPWIALGNGRYRSQSTGRLKYDPWQDPAWEADQRRRAQRGDK
jgi:hypothetical protein